MSKKMDEYEYESTRKEDFKKMMVMKKPKHKKMKPYKRTKV